MMFFKHLSKMFTRGFYFLFIFQTLIALGKPSTQCPEETLLQSAFERQKAKRHFEESLKAFRPTSALAYDHSGSWDAHSPQLISNVDALLQANTLAREKFQEADRTFRKELEKYTADQETLEGPPQSPSLYSTYGSYGEPRLMQTCWKPKTSPQTHGLPPFFPPPLPGLHLPTPLAPQVLSHRESLDQWAEALNTTFPDLHLPRDFFSKMSSIAQCIAEGLVDRAVRLASRELQRLGVFPDDAPVAQALEIILRKLLPPIHEAPNDSSPTVVPSSSPEKIFDIRTVWCHDGAYERYVTGEMIFNFAVSQTSAHLTPLEIAAKKELWEKRKQIINKVAPNGIRWVGQGSHCFPDFSPWVKTKDGKPIQVIITPTGKRNSDRKQAKRAVTSGEEPLIKEEHLNSLQGYVWHHAPRCFLPHVDGQSENNLVLMQLVRWDIHESVPHLGGFSESTGSFQEGESP